MCDEKTLNETLNLMREQARMSRRHFGKLSAVASMAALLPSVANAQDVRSSEIMVETPDGTADCVFVSPSSGRHPGVLIWPDIFGLRPVFEAMAQRLAEAGYAVLVVNPYYRNERAPVVGEDASFQNDETREKLFNLAGTLNADTHVTDARAFIEYLDQREEVDSERQMGTTGYCMGGPMVMRTAATLPDRISAAASFHGGGLVTEDDNSPHQLIPRMRADLLIAIAEDDDTENPEAKEILREAFAEAEADAEIEVYPANHGWCVPGSSAYDEEQAERAWSRLLDLFERQLA